MGNRSIRDERQKNPDGTVQVAAPTRSAFARDPMPAQAPPATAQAASSAPESDGTQTNDPNPGLAGAYRLLKNRGKQIDQQVSDNE